jgi:hypothetical protein
MFRFIFGLLLAATLSGCAAPPAAPIYAGGSLPGSSYRDSRGVPAPTCLEVSAHIKNNGEFVPASYRCLTVEPMAGVPAGVCQSVIGYSLKDGTYLPAHQRCELSSFRSYLAASGQSAYGSTSASAGGSGNASCVTSVCGPVSVRGYTRKDGTYVRPHTRSSPGSKGRK